MAGDPEMGWFYMVVCMAPPYELPVGLVLECILEGTEVGSASLLMRFQSVPHALVLLVLVVFSGI